MSKRLMKFEQPGIESVIVEICIGSKKWCIITIYRSEHEVYGIKPGELFNKMSKSLLVM